MVLESEIASESEVWSGIVNGIGIENWVEIGSLEWYHELYRNREPRRNRKLGALSGNVSESGIVSESEIKRCIGRGSHV